MNKKKLLGPVQVERAFWMVSGACFYAFGSLVASGFYVEAVITLICAWLFIRAGKKLHAEMMKTLNRKIAAIMRDEPELPQEQKA